MGREASPLRSAPRSSPVLNSRQNKNRELLQLTQTADNCYAVDIEKANIQDGQSIVKSGIQADYLYVILRTIDTQGGGLQTINNFVVSSMFLCDDQYLTTHECFSSNY